MGNSTPGLVTRALIQLPRWRAESQLRAVLGRLSRACPTGQSAYTDARWDRLRVTRRLYCAFLEARLTVGTPPDLISHNEKSVPVCGSAQTRGRKPIMNVHELIALLEDCDPEADVRLAHQPGWPLAFELRGVAAPDDAGYEDDEAAATEPGVVWLVEGGHPDDSPYAPNYLWDIARVA